MRYVLFLAALGVVWSGIKLDAGNPAASIFQSAAGDIGYKFFGVVIWCAAITSVIGASYTSVSFWKTLLPIVARKEKIIISLFIIVSTIIFVLRGNPVQLLVLAGAGNGLILPVALAVMLFAATKRSIINDYRHPIILQVIGWLVVIAMSWLGALTIQQNISKLF
jgi:Mn2+/Fe2+ NRAMP family transporter